MLIDGTTHEAMQRARLTPRTESTALECRGDRMLAMHDPRRRCTLTAAGHGATHDGGAAQPPPPLRHRAPGEHGASRHAGRTRA
eukprot:scaffold114449_cov72-Phaeocystis_antarctica.AAC.4